MYNQTYAICPFFLNQIFGKENNKHLSAKTMIRCEGVLGNKASIMSFKTEHQKKVHLKEYCASHNYINCPFARMIAVTNYSESEET